jgi:hypothetical protein
VGTLEGLIPLAVKFGNHVLSQTAIETVDLNVYDFNGLEERFFRGDLDFIFTAREPGRKKYQYSKFLGYQSLELVESNPKFHVMSSFEFGVTEIKMSRHGRSKKNAESQPKTLISNSLSVRRQWLEECGGVGTLPLPVRASKKPTTTTQKIVEEDEVFLYAQDSISISLWEKSSAF